MARVCTYLLFVIAVSSECFLQGAPKKLPRLTIKKSAKNGTIQPAQTVQAKQGNQPQLKKEQEKKPFQVVRVLLHTWEHPRIIPLHSLKGFVVVDTASKKKYFFSADLAIRAHKKGFIINNVFLGGAVLIAPRNGQSTFAGNTYKGVMRLAGSNQSYMLINMLDLEEYVCSVVRTESWPGWPLEVNKVFAIMCRTYAIAMIKQAQKSKKMFDVKNTNVHQTYQGIHDSLIIKEAVRLTKGIFLSHDKQPILAMFDSCCGGVIPAHINAMDFSKAPYLARTYACTFCKRVPLYSWKAEYPTAEFERLVAPAIGLQKKLKDIQVAKKDKAGLVEEVVLKAHNGTHAIHGKKLYSLLKEVKSYFFSAKLHNGKVTLTGRGFGHHIGLCQWGAREMVRDGWHYKRILEFYYPKTHLSKLS